MKQMLDHTLPETKADPITFYHGMTAEPVGEALQHAFVWREGEAIVGVNANPALRDRMKRQRSP